MKPKVDFYFDKKHVWHDAILQLRSIVLSCTLTEELKWGVPCYAFNNKNIVLIHCFKDYCALLFFKGALLQDKFKILIQQTQNVQAARQLRFTSTTEIINAKAKINAYILEAIEIEKSGLQVPLKKNTEIVFIDEFQKIVDTQPKVKKAFIALTPGRQRAYHLYFSAAMQSNTRIARIEKAIPNILEGRGLND